MIGVASRRAAVKSAIHHTNTSCLLMRIPVACFDEEVSGDRAETGVEDVAEEKEREQRLHVSKIGIEVAADSEDEVGNETFDRADDAGDHEYARALVLAPWRDDRADDDADRSPDAEVHAGQDRNRCRRKEDGDARLDFE